MLTIKKLLTLFKKPEYIAALLALLFGLAFIVAIRPLSIPDEPNHFLRAYQVSQGNIFVERNGPDGCMQEFGNISHQPETMQFLVPKSVALFTSLDRNNYSIKEQIAKPLNQSDKIGVCMRQTQANSPIGYLPQALAIALLRPFNTSPILLDYAARLSILLCWVGFIFAAVRVMPIRKWTVVGIALLPMATQQSISIGADALSIAPAALFVAIIVRSYYENRHKYIKQDLTLLSTLVVIATLSKPVMIALIVLLAFYNFGKSNISLATKFAAIGVAAAVPLLCYLLWAVLAGHSNLSVTDVFPLAHMHINFIKESPHIAIPEFMAQTVHFIFHGFSLDQFGAFEWFTVSIPQTWRFIGIAGLLLILLAGYKEKIEPLKTISRNKLLGLNLATVVSAVGIVFANIVTLYLIWTPMGAQGVEGVQFRYFLPAFFVLAGLVGMKFIRVDEQWYRNFVLINATIFFIISILTIMRVL